MLHHLFPLAVGGSAGKGSTMTRRDYFGDNKPILLELVDPVGLRVLDAGCGAGVNGELFKRAGAREVWGIEIDPGAAEEARRRLDGVVGGDLMSVTLDDLGGQKIDAVLAIDVLEHLVDPAAGLARLVEMLHAGGLVVACIPNVAHVWVIANLMAKRWPRKKSGIFDRTHLRFFARRDMVALLRGAGLDVVEVRPCFTRFRSLKALALVLSLYVFRDYWARQFLLVARKPVRQSRL
jgi:2-polyprenyl-3-methyl-5-hydroxy-6-metoxy-1,4-benzoquinol methylase